MHACMSLNSSHYTIQGSFITSGVQIENHKLIIYQIARKLGSLEKARQHLIKCLYYVNLGRSDYLNNYFLPHSPTHIYSPQQYATVLMEELSLNLLVPTEIFRFSFFIYFTKDSNITIEFKLTIYNIMV